jgi:hypothetical protein
VKADDFAGIWPGYTGTDLVNQNTTLTTRRGGERESGSQGVHHPPLHRHARPHDAAPREDRFLITGYERKERMVVLAID